MVLSKSGKRREGITAEYRIRFMPDALGSWRYSTRSNRSELDGRRQVARESEQASSRLVRPAFGVRGPQRLCLA